ncbi:T9SS type A sorting domain-containing protein [Aquimarina algiphila]|uniref:T9SS type A sorting domain-containing protein n=1 Tax=Aquimarina algiphila TaxID=2047982 RepID=UPI0024934653|nr:T9SS type A sorting domain-containing protein [Aquimarina algiphila]
MKKVLTILAIALPLLFTQLAVGQVVTECNGVVNPSNRLWADFEQKPNNPKQLPVQIPKNINYPGLVKKEIEPTYNALKTAIDDLVANKGGVISFKNVGSGKTISFNEVIPIWVRPASKPCITILIEGDNKITFDGGKKSSMFYIRSSVKVVIQNTIFKNAKLTKQVVNDGSNTREGGGAIEVTAGAAVRVYGCTFLDNSVTEYNGVGENKNGAGIRLNYHSTGEVFKSVFRNSRARFGGAIGATSINKLTIMDCLFEKNTALSYGAIRVDRTAKPIEIYRTTFKENDARETASVMEVFIRPLRDNGAETGPYPSPSGFALIIEDCVFENNGYDYPNGASLPEKGDFFAANIMFHGGSTNNNFRGARMKINNTTFVGNEVGESNIRAHMGFEITNTIFANTKMVRLRTENNVFRGGKGALTLRGGIPNQGVINNCTFYNNEPNPDDPVNRGLATDIFFWDGDDAKYVVNNCIFYRKNKNSKLPQVSKPVKGSGHNQFIPGVNMVSFPKASNSSVNITDPNIVPKNIVDMCLGNNTLPKNIGGLPDCSGTDGGDNGGNELLIANGTYFIESTTSNQRLFSNAARGHNAHMEAPKNFDTQKWIFNHLGDDIYTIKNVKTQRFLEVPHARCKNNTQVATWTDVLGNHQKWKIVLNGADKYSLMPAHCLTQALDRSNGTLNTNIQTFKHFVNSRNQKWKIKLISLSKATDLIKETSNIKIYPNPAKDYLTINGLKENNAIKIYDLLGKTIISVETNHSEETIDLRTLHKGLYVVSISGKKQMNLLIE